jgi:hypothetical protein
MRGGCTHAGRSLAVDVDIDVHLLCGIDLVARLHALDGHKREYNPFVKDIRGLGDQVPLRLRRWDRESVRDELVENGETRINITHPHPSRHMPSPPHSASTRSRSTFPSLPRPSHPAPLATVDPRDARIASVRRQRTKDEG